MNRESIYYLPEGSTESTFCYDEDRPRLPLPKLDHTLKRYLESLKPFGTAEELENTKKIIETFRKGVGAKLQTILEEKAAKEKNWVSMCACELSSTGALQHTTHRTRGYYLAQKNESHIFQNI